jgi:hypothetical protein
MSSSFSHSVDSRLSADLLDEEDQQGAAPGARQPLVASAVEALLDEEADPLHLGGPAPEEETAGPDALGSSLEADSESDEFSIESYMRDLLARHGSADAKPAAAAVPAFAPPRIQSPSSLSVPQKAVEPQPRRIPTSASAVKLDLGTMREAANVSAVSAIGTYDCKQLVVRSYRVLVLAGCSFLAAWALLASSAWIHRGFYPVSILAIATGLACVGTYVYYTHRLIRHLQGAAKPTPGRSEKVAGETAHPPEPPGEQP